MSYKIEGKDIVIQGFEEGIAETPYKGIGDMRNLNNSSVPQEASVAFRTANDGPTAVSGEISVSLPSPTTQIFTETGTFRVPAGTTVDIEAVGAGGGGAAGGELGGGGGGAYSASTGVPIVPLTTYDVEVGVGGAPDGNGGDSYWDTNTNVMAKGGSGATSDTGAAGGQASASVGDTKFDGGDGGNGESGGGGIGGGGGGGAANASGAGGNGGNGFQGAPPSSGGGGGAGGDNGGNGSTNAGGAPGGNGSSGTGGSSGGAAGTGTGGGAGGFLGIGGAGGSSGGGGGGGATAGGNGGAIGGGGGGGPSPSGTGGRGQVSVTYTPAPASISYSGLVGNIYNIRSVVFSGVSLPGGIEAGVPYYIGELNTGAMTFNLFYDANLTDKVEITSAGTGTFVGLMPTRPTYFASQTKINDGLSTYEYFMVDDTGHVWWRYSVVNTWIFLGNTEFEGAHGNGLGVYHGYLFVWRSAYLDYLPLSDPLDTGAWVYGWDPATGGAGPTAISNLGAPTSAFSHETIVATDDAMYSCDATYLQSFVRNAGEVFNPTDINTFTWNQQALGAPVGDTFQSLAELGVNLLIGGALKAIYPWDRVSTSYSYPILIADSFIRKIVTLNNNSYIFAGRRGKIYITNGSQAEEWKKVPDFLSGTVEPYYEWGGAAINRDDIYFGVRATTNNGTAINQYGGLWAVNTKTNALRLLNKLSYNNYTGLVTAIAVINQNYQTAPALGYSLYIGWEDGEEDGGIDTYPGGPYTDSSSYLDSDMIPIGTFLDPFTPSQLEWKVSVPLVAGESVALYYRTSLNGAYTLIPTTTASLVGAVSDLVKANFQKAQWLQIRAVLTSTDTTPTYTRLTEIRIRDFPS